jgi:hypothetical protein
MEWRCEMRKKLLGLLVAILLVLGSVQAALATDSTLTQTLKCYGQGNACLLTLAWTAKSTDGTFTATALTAAKMTTLAGYYLYEMETDPGASGAAPTDNYDITITSSATGYAKDILGGAGADRSTTVTQAVYPKNTDTYRFPPVGGDTWTLAITNNSNGSATGIIRLWFVK